MVKNILKIKAVISSILFVLLLIVTITGIGLYFAPSERIAQTTGWFFLNLTKFQLENLHTITSFAMVALLTVHLALNLNMFKIELKEFFKKKE